MRAFFKVALGLAALFAATLSAPAQVNTVPQVGVTSNYITKVTYSAGFIGLPPAASATDVVCLAGSASKIVKLMNVTLSGTAGTLVSLPITLVRRTAVNTGGTAATTTANPANNISKRDTTSPTASAVPIAYSANPTITDSSPTYLASAATTFPVTSAGTVIVPLVFDFTDTPALVQPVTLRGAAEQVCLNFNAVSVSSGVLNGSLTWTEE